MSTTLNLLRIIPVVFLCGCAGYNLHRTYSEYSEMYAKSVNEQLLLNLARLSHDEPPYFIQLGQMNAQFTLKTGFGFTPSHTGNTPAARAADVGSSFAKDAFTLGGSATLELTENPIFN